MIAYNLKGSGSLVLTDEVRGYLDQKLDRVEKLINENDTAVKLDVELGTVSNARTGNMFRAELNFSFSGGFIRAEETCDTLHAAIDAAVDELVHELKKKVGKQRDLMRRGASKVKDFFRYFTGGN